MRYFIGKEKISKFDKIEVECKKAREKLGRKESYKVRDGSINIVDRSLSKPKVDWKNRDKIVLPHRVLSIEELEEAHKRDKTSLGLLKPKEIIDFYNTEELQIYKKTDLSYTVNLDGDRIPIVLDIPHIFKYKFTCESGTHNMQCEDWELFESYRRWGQRYKNIDILWEKLKDKFFYKMKNEKDLHFIMGTHSQYPTWFIIGLYYPPKKKDRSKSNQKRLFM